MLKALDLFSGVGGLSLGLRNAGFSIVMANEIDQDIADAYTRNHPGITMVNDDITKLDISTTFGELKGKIDLVVGGPPCQGFSQKGSRDILDDDRNFLFKYFFKVVRYLRPTYFLMENVPNLITSNNGAFKKEIFNLFEGIGYKLDSDVLNAYNYGVPQLRRRAFILGKLNSNIGLPLESTEKVTIKDAIWDLAYLSSGEGKEVQDYKFEPLSSYQKKMRQGANKLYNHKVTKHSQLAIERMKLIPIGKGKEVLPTNHLTKSIYSGTWSRMLEDQPSVTITTRFDTPSSGRFTHPYLHRAITVREAARIQSFPDTFIFYGSKTSQMKQVGNAIPPILAQCIASKISNDFKSREKIIL